MCSMQASNICHRQWDETCFCAWLEERGWIGPLCSRYMQNRQTVAAFPSRALSENFLLPCRKFYLFEVYVGTLVWIVDKQCASWCNCKKLPGPFPTAIVAAFHPRGRFKFEQSQQQQGSKRNGKKQSYQWVLILIIESMGYIYCPQITRHIICKNFARII